MLTPPAVQNRLEVLEIFNFFFNDPATTEIYTLSLHDALPIYPAPAGQRQRQYRLRHDRSRVGRLATEPRPSRDRRRERHGVAACDQARSELYDRRDPERSEEHTSELQSLAYLVCRLLLEKKKQ